MFVTGNKLRDVRGFQMEAWTFTRSSENLLPVRWDLINVDSDRELKVFAGSSFSGVRTVSVKLNMVLPQAGTVQNIFDKTVGLR